MQFPISLQYHLYQERAGFCKGSGEFPGKVFSGSYRCGGNAETGRELDPVDDRTVESNQGT